MESKEYIRMIVKLLKSQKLKVRCKTYTKAIHGSNYYERGLGGGDNCVWVFTEITKKNDEEIQRRTFIGSYPVNKKIHGKIVKALNPPFGHIEYIGGEDEATAFKFVGVWDNEKYGRYWR